MVVHGEQWGIEMVDSLRRVRQREGQQQQHSRRKIGAGEL